MSDDGFGTFVLIALLIGAVAGAVTGWSFRGDHETWKRCQAECAPVAGTVRDEACFCLVGAVKGDRDGR